jgi:hypothetical protein
MLVSSGDSLATFLVVRFDSLSDAYIVGGDSIPIVAVDSTHLRLFLDTARTAALSAVTFELFDVDTTAADADMVAIRALFRQDRMISSTSVVLGLQSDTLDLPIPNELLLAKTADPSRRLRVGVRITSNETARVVVFSANTVAYPRLRYDPAPNDPVFNVLERSARSHTPENDPVLALRFTDYAVPAGGAFPLQRVTAGSDTAELFRDSLLVAGGVDGRRIYLRFALPDSILNSSIVRATLILNKRPSSDYDLRDTVAVVPKAVFATAGVPVSKAADITDSLRIFEMPVNRMEARTSGEIRFDIGAFARSWTTDSRMELPPAIVLHVGLEGKTMHEMHFYSSTAPLALRPRLRVTFVPRLQIGSQ